MTLPHRLVGVRSWVLLTAGAVSLGLVLEMAASKPGGRRPEEEWCKEEARHSRIMDEQVHALVLRIRSKSHITDEVIASRLSLLEAAAQFRILNRMPPSVSEEQARSQFAGDTEEERLCREVIHWVATAMRESEPFLSAAVYVHLESQLNDHLQRGPLGLPDGQVRGMESVSDPQ